MPDDRSPGGGNAQPSDETKGLKASEARGLVAKEAWVQDGLLVRREKLAQRWGVSLEEIAAMVARGELFELEVSGQLWMPAVNLELPRDVVAEINRVLSGVDAATAFVFWHRRHGALGGSTVAEALRHDTSTGRISKLALAFGMSAPMSPRPVLATVPDVGLLVRKLRFEAGVTQVQLAEMTGIPVNTLSRFERGRLPDFSLGRTLRLLRVLRRTIAVVPSSEKPTSDDLLREVRAGENTGPASR